MLLWHYTSADVLTSIFSNPKQPILRATHINYLNDSEELRYGLVAFLDTARALQLNEAQLNEVELAVADLLRDDFDPHIFSFSLSEAENSLYQWLVYSPKDRGIALGFDFIDHNVFSLYLPNSTNEVQIPQYRECRYINPDKPIEQSWFTWDKTKLTKVNLLINAMFIKHNAFNFEQEHRLFFHPESNSDSWRFVPTKFNGSKPYVEFNFDPNILKVIYISPRGNKFLTERLIKKMLATYELTHVEVKVSDIPFRE